MNCGEFVEPSVEGVEHGDDVDGTTFGTNLGESHDITEKNRHQLVFPCQCNIGRDKLVNVLQHITIYCKLKQRDLVLNCIHATSRGENDNNYALIYLFKNAIMT